MTNDNFIEFDDLIVTVNEVYSNCYICQDCGKKFLILGTDPETQDFNVFYNDNVSQVSDLGCHTHILFDLFADDSNKIVIIMPQKLSDIVVGKPIFAYTFLLNRLN